MQPLHTRARRVRSRSLGRRISMGKASTAAVVPSRIAETSSSIVATQHLPNHAQWHAYIRRNQHDWKTPPGGGAPVRACQHAHHAAGRRRLPSILRLQDAASPINFLRAFL